MGRCQRFGEGYAGFGEGYFGYIQLIIRKVQILWFFVIFSILTISLLQHSNFDKFGLMVIQKAIFGYFFCNFDRDCHVHRSDLKLERADYWEYKTKDFSGFKFFDLLPKNCLPDGWDRKCDFEWHKLSYMNKNVSGVCMTEWTV